MKNDSSLKFDITMTGYRDEDGKYNLLSYDVNIPKDLEDLEDQINLHLVKIIRYKDDLNFEKYLKDVKNWLVQIQKMDVGKKNKKLPEKEYFKLLFTQPFTDATNIKRIQDYEKSDLKDYLKLPRIRSEQETVELLFKIHKEIAKRLSNNDIWDIEDYISNLLK